MSLEERGGGRARRPGLRNTPRIWKFLIAMILIVALFTIYGVRSAGKGGSLPVTATVGTAGPTPTATLVVPVPTQAAFYETFVDNRHNWALSNQDGFLRALTNGRLMLTNVNPRTTLVESVPNEMMYDNYTLKVSFAVQGGDTNDSVGVYVRGDSNLDHDYRIDINGDNTFDIAKEYLDRQSMPHTSLLDGPKNIAQLRPPGQYNTMTAILQGPLLRVTLNNALIGSVSDSDYTSGQIALFVRHGTTSAAVTMIIKTLEVDRLD